MHAPPDRRVAMRAIWHTSPRGIDKDRRLEECHHGGKGADERGAVDRPRGRRGRDRDRDPLRPTRGAPARHADTASVTGHPPYGEPGGARAAGRSQQGVSGAIDSPPPPPDRHHGRRHRRHVRDPGGRRHGRGALRAGGGANADGDLERPAPGPLPARPGVRIRGHLCPPGRRRRAHHDRRWRGRSDRRRRLLGPGQPAPTERGSGRVRLDPAPTGGARPFAAACRAIRAALPARGRSHRTSSTTP